MKRTWFGRAVSIAADVQGVSQRQIAIAQDISASTINRSTNGPRRPDVETLKAIVSYAWPKAGTGVQILIEHLRDEVERAGMPDGSVKMTAGESKAAPRNSTNAAHTLDLIRAVDKDIYDHVIALINDLYELTHGGHIVHQQPTRVAAEPRPKWTRKNN